MNKKPSLPSKTRNPRPFSLPDAHALIDQLQVFSMRLDARTTAIMEVLSPDRAQCLLLRSLSSHHMEVRLQTLTEADPLWGARLHAIYQAQLALESVEEGASGPN